MGNIHTPKTIYKYSLVMEFKVKNNEIYYTLKKWDEQGINQSLILSAKLENKNPDDIIKEAQRMFTDVGVNQ